MARVSNHPGLRRIMKKDLLVDVDGVMAQYDGKFVEGQLGDPIHGAPDGIAKLREKYKVTVYTTRELSLFTSWASKHGIEWDNYIQKPLCFALLDDRAVQFKGDWNRAIEEIENFKPWWKV
jgi:hypothetical protein